MLDWLEDIFGPSSTWVLGNQNVPVYFPMISGYLSEPPPDKSKALTGLVLLALAAVLAALLLKR